MMTEERTEQLRNRRAEVARLIEQGYGRHKIAAMLGMTPWQARGDIEYCRRQSDVPPEIAASMSVDGMPVDATLRAVWLKTKPSKDKPGHSAHYVFPDYGSDIEKLSEVLNDALKDIETASKPVEVETLALREDAPEPGHLCVLDPADVHIGKLCVLSETGYVYNRAAVKDRVAKAARDLHELARLHPIDRIVLVIGNDILHADRWNGTTTSGTMMDGIDGSWTEWFKDALDFYVQLVVELLRTAPVHLVYCPSNHDWQSGYYLSQTLGAWFRNEPRVHGTGQASYYISLRHRKYFVFHDNLIGFTHGDGAPEAQLPAIMQHEMREFWGQTRHAVWYTHHTHSKHRKRYGLRGSQIETDHVGVSVISTAEAREGHAVDVEVVRSPSPPDSWHDRNGFLNRQAVECFLHHPKHGQVHRYTVWL